MRANRIAILLVACGGSSSKGSADAGPPRPDGAVIPPGDACVVPVTPVDTSSPDHLITTCDQATLATAIAAGGTIAFSCGSPTTIPITTTLDVPTDRDTTIDGGGMVTLDGGGTTQILSFDHPDYRKNTHTLTLQHLKLAHGHNHGTKPYADATPPCSSGFYDGYGGAVYVRDGELVVIDCAFDSNEAEALGPDVGGGALSLNGSLRVVVAGSTFTNNKASNGPAIQSLNSELDVYDSTFSANLAEGHGANGNNSSMCSTIADNGQHQTGSGGNGGAISIDGGSDGTHTFCGDTFSGNTSGAGALGGAIFRTPDIAKQTTVIDRSTFTGNQGDSAAALYFHNSTLQISASTFDHNTASQGSGAIQADGTTFQFENDTFSDNSALAGLGGAVSLFGGDGTIAFCTFADNHADGGDPYFGAAIAGNPTLTLTSSLFANNTAKNPGAPMQCMVDGTGDGDLQWPMDHVVGGGADALCTPTVTFADPMLASLADNGGPTQTRLPASGSPAIGAGVACPAIDQRGNARPSTGCTSGAVEGSH